MSRSEANGQTVKHLLRTSCPDAEYMRMSESYRDLPPCRLRRRDTTPVLGHMGCRVSVRKSGTSLIIGQVPLPHTHAAHQWLKLG